MLIRLTTNRQEFQPINFRPGFNAVVAERAADSTDQDSRNARGKSTLLLFINYVLAGNRHKSLKPLAEAGWEISLTLQMFGGVVTATRSLDAGKRIGISADATALRAIEPYLNDGYIGINDWKDLLGLAFFRLEPSDQEVVGGLSARTLLSYVIRTDTPKDPLKILPQQSATSSRQHVSFLLGLDWGVVHELAAINKGLDQIDAITAATRDGLVTSLRTEEELMLERATARSDVDEWESRIAGFRILASPNSLVERANELTSRIANLRDEAVVDRRMRALYLASLEEPADQAGSEPLVDELFAAAGAVLADGFRRQIDDVRAFHAAILENRRSFLRAEVSDLDRRIGDRTSELDRLDEQRDATLRTLEAGGLLEELNSMRAELNEAQGRVATIDAQIEQARDIVNRREDLKFDRSNKRTRAAHELTTSRGKLDQVAERFSQKMRRLYGKDAALTVSVDESGFKFRVQVIGAGSTGVDRMTMFCFDLTMLEEGVQTGHHPDFLIHDSSVFDGVDPRQRAGAFLFAQQIVEATGGQYICTINSNDVPDDVLAQKWFREGVVRTVLDTEPGGLTGRTF